MKTTDMIKYICYRLVELANDKIGQIMIAVPFAVTIMILSYIDGSKHSDTTSFIRIVITLMVIYSLILLKYLKTILLLKPEDRMRVFRSISFANILALVFSTVGLYPIYTTWYGIAVRVILAIFIIGSLLTKSNSVYLSEK